MEKEDQECHEMGKIPSRHTHQHEDIAAQTVVHVELLQAGQHLFLCGHSSEGDESVRNRNKKRKGRHNSERWRQRNREGKSTGIRPVKT